MSLDSRESTEWVRWVSAGCAYALAAFLIGFGLGTLRVLVLVPHLGATLAVSLEAPVMLIVSWNLSRWCTKRFDVRDAVGPRVLMGLVAFMVLMAAELGVSVGVFGRSVTDHFSSYASLPGVIGLAAQLGFASFPAWQVSRSRA